jgi:hypothetical protein
LPTPARPARASPVATVNTCVPPRTAGPTVSDHLTPEHVVQVGLGFWASQAFTSAFAMGVVTEVARHPAQIAYRSYVRTPAGESGIVAPGR